MEVEEIEQVIRSFKKGDEVQMFFVERVIDDNIRQKLQAILAMNFKTIRFLNNSYYYLQCNSHPKAKKLDEFTRFSFLILDKFDSECFEYFIEILLRPNILKSIEIIGKELE